MTLTRLAVLALLTSGTTIFDLGYRFAIMDLEFAPDGKTGSGYLGVDLRYLAA